MEVEKKSSIIKTVIILSALLIAGLILVFPARQFFQKAQEINKEIQAKEQEKKALEQRLVDLKQLEINYNEAKEKSKGIANALPTEKNWPDLLTELENVASNSGLRFAEVKSQSSSTGTTNQPGSSSNPTSGAIYKELPLSVALEGNFLNLKNYLKNLEKNIRILDVNSITISRYTDPTTGDKYLQISLDMNGYFQNKK